MNLFDFSTPIDRHGTWCTQWDFVADRFGVDGLLPFTISDMDFVTAPCVLAALQARLTHGVLGYSRWQHDDFLSAIRHWYSERFDCPIDTDMAIYGPSVIYMVAQLIRLWSQPGEGVVTHTPAYDAFYKVVNDNQRTLLSSPLHQDDDGIWRYDSDQFENLLAQPSTKILLLCSPQNPTGKVWTYDELETIARLCERHNVKVISDEIHMDMVWSEHPHTPWSKVGRTPWALVTSASKSFNIPALTGAYGLISDQTTRDNYFLQLKNRDGLSSPAVLAVVAHIAAYRQGQEWLDALRHYLKSNLQYVAERLNNAFPQLNWQPPQATYLAWIDLCKLGIDDHLLQQQLIQQQKVAIMPGFTYGEQGRGFIRLNVGCPRSKLEAGMDKLINALKALHSSDSIAD